MAAVETAVCTVVEYIAEHMSVLVAEQVECIAEQVECIAGKCTVVVQVEMLGSALLCSSMTRISMSAFGSHLNSTLLHCSMSSGSSDDSFPSSLSCMASYSMLMSLVWSSGSVQLETLD